MEWNNPIYGESLKLIAEVQTGLKNRNIVASKGDDYSKITINLRRNILHLNSKISDLAVDIENSRGKMLV